MSVHKMQTGNKLEDSSVFSVIEKWILAPKTNSNSVCVFYLICLYVGFLWVGWARFSDSETSSVSSDRGDVKLSSKHF